MASTYTVNLGIEKIGTGEQSGTWGNTTNTNFDLIDQAVNGAVTVTLASAGTSGSPNSLVITNGAASDGRNKFIEFNDGGDLGATAYVQLDPNDAEKIVHMRNSLSGGRSVIVFQGTYNASNDFEIPNGKDVVLKFDGAGASATVTDVFTDLQATAITTPDLTATTADINGGTIDGATLGGSSQVTITDADMNGGTIDGVVIGGATPAAGSFTTVAADSATLESAAPYLVLSETDQTDLNAYIGNSAGKVSIRTISDDLGTLTKRLEVDHATGDISFYEDTGTTPKFFWDASAEALGIGTSSPSDDLHISSSAPAIRLSDTDASSGGYGRITCGASGNVIFYADPSDVQASTYMAFNVDNSEAMRIDSSGNVGIGTTTPSFATGTGLEIQRTTATATLRLEYTGSNAFELSSEQNTVTYNSVSSKPHVFEIGSVEKARIDANGNVGIGAQTVAQKLLASTGVDTDAGTIAIGLGSVTDSTRKAIFTKNTTSPFELTIQSGAGGTTAPIVFKQTASGEAMRLDASGNLLVGKTASNYLNQGAEVRASGVMVATATSSEPLSLNRKTTDGAIVGFYKDGTTVGSIASRAGAVTTLVLDPRTNGCGITGTLNGFLPTDETGALDDATQSIGGSTNRFKDLYLSGGFPGTAAGSLVINENSVDFDFRVESDTNTHALFVDAGNSKVGINNSAPTGHLAINGLQISVLSRAYTMSTTPVEVLQLDNQGNSPVFIRVYRKDTSSPQGSELIELYIACSGSGTNITSVTLVQDDKVQIGSIHNVTFTAAVVSNNAHISITGDDNGGESQSLVFEVHHVEGYASIL